MIKPKAKHQNIKNEMKKASTTGHQTAEKTKYYRINYRKTNLTNSALF